MGPLDDRVRDSAMPGVPFQRRVSQAVGVLASRQKPGAGVPAYMRWVNRRAARFLAALAFAVGLRPNTVTTLSLGVSLAAFGLIVGVPASGWLGLAIAVCLALAFALDSADGQLARLMGLSGPSGEWFDHVVDAFRAPALHLSVAVAAWLQFDSETLAVTGLILSLAVSAQFMSQILAEQLRGAPHQTPQRSNGDRQSWLLLPTDPGVWAWIFVLWGWPILFAIAYVVLAALNFVHIGASMSRRYRELTSVQGN